jgi:hypothetical protein
MKAISNELRERLKTEQPNAELVLALLNETDPDDYCEEDYALDERGSPYFKDNSSIAKCCILGRIGLEKHGDPIAMAEEYRYITLDNQNLAHINNGVSKDYPQKTPYERVKAAMEDLIKLKNSTK